jgi:hypothetical protein
LNNLTLDIVLTKVVCNFQGYSKASIRIFKEFTGLKTALKKIYAYLPLESLLTTGFGSPPASY